MPRITDRIALQGFKPGTRDKKKCQQKFAHEAVLWDELESVVDTQVKELNDGSNSSWADEAATEFDPYN